MVKEIGRGENLKIDLPVADQDLLHELDEIRKDNFEILGMFADCLTNDPQGVTEREIQRLSEERGLDSTGAFRTLLALQCGLDPEKFQGDHRLFRDYFEPSIQMLDPFSLENDSYHQFLRGKKIRSSCWELKSKKYAPYEIFVRDDLLVTEDFREIPQLGFFEREYSYPQVLQDAREWMTITPNEVATMRLPLAAYHDRVAVYGLGLGYFAFKAAEKETVESVVVIEKDRELIDLFKRNLLSDFPQGDKIRIIHADAFDYAEQSKAEHFDFAFVDLWHDLGDGFPLWLRMKKQEHFHPETTWFHWIETTFLSHLRWSLFATLKQAMSRPVELLIDVNIESFDDLRACLSDDFLKKLAEKL